MAKHIVQDRCTRCGACVPVCPNEGVEEILGAYIILSGLCTECYGFAESSRCAAVCAADAIEDEPGSIQPEEALAGRAADLRPDHFPRD